MFGLSELAVVLVVIAVVIAVKKGPELARSAGKAARVLKAEGRAMKETDDGRPEREPRVIPGETVTPPGPRAPEDGRH
ncbi:twin-arginine translocase TatA/TatE family subunit [Streptomyces sp. NPDC048290]|uniref:twin-arginine translocase TatA/TatE family subunit n=1 Tax=Streptomyces sp. NPDC048290 TaxID=3155811 RepID=UPI003423DD23